MSSSAAFTAVKRDILQALSDLDRLGTGAPQRKCYDKEIAIMSAWTQAVGRIGEAEATLETRELAARRGQHFITDGAYAHLFKIIGEATEG